MESHLLDETHTPAFRALLGKNNGHELLAAARWAVLALAFLVPVWFMPGLADSLGLPKQALLIVGAWAVLLILSGVSLFAAKVRERLPIYIWASFLALITVSAASVIFSLDRWAGLLGSEGAVSSSLMTTVALVALVASVPGLFSGRDVLRPILAAALGASLSSLLGLLQSLGLPLLALPGGAAANTVGTIGDAANVAAVGAVAASGLLASGAAGWRGLTLKAILVSGFIADLLFLTVVDAGRSWMILLPGAAAVVVLGLVRGVTSMQTFLPAAAALVVGILLSIFPTPVRSGLPSEITVSLTGSYSIAWQTASRRLLGSGPETFGLDYAAYRPREVLVTPLWDRRFDRPSSALAGTLAEMGLPGLVVGLVLLLVLFRVTLAAFHSAKLGGGRTAGIVLLPLAVTLAAAAILTPGTLVGRFLFFLTLGCAIAALPRYGGGRPRPGGADWSRGTVAAIFLSALILATASLAGVIMRVAGAAAAGNGGAAYADLQSAGRRDPTEDGYPRFFAATLERDVRAGRLPADRNELEALVSRGIEAARRSTQLGPNEPENWGAEGALYAVLAPGIQGAADYSLAAYGRAEELEPGNPRWPLARGRVLLARAAAVRKMAQGENEAVRAEANRRINADLEAAIGALSRAVEIKPDYYPALFELAMAYGEAGKTKEAVSRLEAVARANPQDVGVAYQLGLLYYRQDDLTRAALEFERAVSLAPTFANARWFLSSVRERQGQLNRAIEILEQLLKSLPNDPRITVKLRELRAGVRSETPVIPLGE